MKRTICLFLAVALAALAAVCLVFRPPEAVEITVEQTHWAGEKDFVPTKQTQTCERRVGDVIQCGGWLDLEATVSRISNSSVTIETNTPMIDKYASADTPLSYETRFTIRKDKPLCLVTPIMDAGDIFVFSILQ